MLYRCKEIDGFEIEGSDFMEVIAEFIEVFRITEGYEKVLRCETREEYDNEIVNCITVNCYILASSDCASTYKLKKSIALYIRPIS